MLLEADDFHFSTHTAPQITSESYIYEATQNKPSGGLIGGKVNGTGLWFGKGMSLILLLPMKVPQYLKEIRCRRWQ